MAAENAIWLGKLCCIRDHAGSFVIASMEWTLIEFPSRKKVFCIQSSRSSGPDSVLFLLDGDPFPMGSVETRSTASRSSFKSFFFFLSPSCTVAPLRCLCVNDSNSVLNFEKSVVSIPLSAFCDKLTTPVSSTSIDSISRGHFFVNIACPTKNRTLKSQK